MSPDRIKTELVREDHGPNSTLLLRVSVDGVECSSSVLLAGPRRDVEEVQNDTATVPEVQARWRKKVRR